MLLLGLLLPARRRQGRLLGAVRQQLQLRLRLRLAELGWLRRGLSRRLLVSLLPLLRLRLLRGRRLIDLQCHGVYACATVSY